MKINCHICANESLKIFDALILNKYRTDYFQCTNCGFIQTEKPTWLNEAYVSAITSIDVGLVYRNLGFSNIIPSILDIFSTEDDSYLDYGGGYGLFVRIMRDKGYDFYLQDVFAENLFAKYFELKDYNKKAKFAALTAFEVFEHLENPVDELKKMFELSDTLIFSTELQPVSTYSSVSDWWYFVPETGQHLSFYSTRSLEILSEQCECNFYTNKYDLHILTKLDLKQDPFIIKPPEKKRLEERIISKFLTKKPDVDVEVNKRLSLLKQDFELYKKHLQDAILT